MKVWSIAPIQDNETHQELHSHINTSKGHTKESDSQIGWWNHQISIWNKHIYMERNKGHWHYHGQQNILKILKKHKLKFKIWKIDVNTNKLVLQ